LGWQCPRTAIGSLRIALPSQFDSPVQVRV